MKAAKDVGNDKNKTESSAQTTASKKQTLDELIREKGDYYNNLNTFVSSIKEFESKGYKNFSDFSRGFVGAFNGYIQQSELKDDEKAKAFGVAMNYLVNQTPQDTDNIKSFISRMIDYIRPVLTADFEKVKNSLGPDEYHKMAKGAMADPMVMFNPFAANLKQELGKNDGYRKCLKLTELINDMKKDSDANNFSKIAGYFEKIPYDPEVYKKANISDADRIKMDETLNKLFEDVTAKLNEESKKELMMHMIGSLTEENNKRFSGLDKDHAVNSFNSSGMDPATGLYLALNSGKYTANESEKLDPRIADMFKNAGMYGK
ncbi:hypothetical protein M1112_02780 [Candidatus Parvarchaeota archaeon]|nr:hypothetical protein [Candidatus Parvarchaeota archaeon]